VTGSELEQLVEALVSELSWTDYLARISLEGRGEDPDKVSLVARWFAGERYQSAVPFKTKTSPPEPRRHPEPDARTGPLELGGDFDGVELP
jgi:hypothetical protein